MRFIFLDKLLYLIKKESLRTFGRWNYFYYTNMMYMLKMVMMISDNRKWVENSSCFWTIKQQGSLKRGRDSTKKFEEHDILTFCLLHVNNQDLIHTLTCTAGSIKVALGIGNWVIVSYCLVVTQGNHIALFGMPKCPITNLYLISYIQCSFWRSDNHKL